MSTKRQSVIVAIATLAILLAATPISVSGQGLSLPSTPVSHVQLLNDTTPPNINITEPKDGSKVVGIILVTVNATDDTNVSYVEFRVDAVLRSNSSESPFNWTWDTRDTPNGTHTINATAFDEAGNFNWSVVSVMIDNDHIAPSISIVSPKNGAIVTSDIVVTANASDDRGNLSHVLFKVDGVVRFTNDTPSGPYNWKWNASMEKNGLHTINVTAYDKWNNNASDEISVNVQIKDTMMPSIEIDSPSDGSDVFGVVAIYFSVNDNVGIKKVEVSIDFKVAYTNTSGNIGSYTYDWDTISATIGVHVINASTEDTSGNIAWDSIMVTVSNVPSPQVSTPQPEDTVIGTVLIEGTTSSLLVTEVHVKIDSLNWSVANGTANWKIYWNTTKIANGAHNLSLRATDGKKYSAIITMRVYVNNPPLECTITAPKEKDQVSGQVNVTGTAAKGTSWIEVSIDGSNWTKAKGNLTWYIYWDTTKEANGKHTVNARAYNEIWRMYTPIFSVGVNVSNEQKQNAPALDPQVAGGIVTLLAIILIILYLYTLGKKKPTYQDEDEELTDEESETERKIKGEKIKEDKEKVSEKKPEKGKPKEEVKKAEKKKPKDVDDL